MRSQLLFMATMFLSAMLLFSVQPMFAKMVLPLLGGTPAVWNTCLVFFQAVLLAGYGYAHLSTGRLGLGRQPRWHLAVLLLPLVALPIRLPGHWTPPAETNPTWWLLGLLTVAVGLPFLVVSTGAPLLQRWFAATGHPKAKDPYFLYAASNLGSFVALIGYVVLIEPNLRLPQQSMLWAVGYCILIVLIALCSRLITPARARAADRSLRMGEALEALPWSRRIRWVLLSFVPSSLMLGVTTYLSTDIAAVPLLWIIPMSLYLLTFVIAFSRRPIISHSLAARGFQLAFLPLAVLMIIRDSGPASVLIGLHLAVFFFAALACHGLLAQDRPNTSHLTEFYFWMSLGGVMGGAFNALAAPVLFESVVEYPLAMVLACLLLPTGSAQKPRGRRWMDYALAAAVGLLTVGLWLSLEVLAFPSRLMQIVWFCGLPAVVCAAFRRRPIRFGLSVGALLLVGLCCTSEWQRELRRGRSFFGVYRVEIQPGNAEAPWGFHQLMHGTTLHGAQSLDVKQRCEPLTYYGTPLKEVLQVAAAKPGARIAVVGLGTGSSAGHARPDQHWTFYEIDPLVRDIASDPNAFTFLRDCVDDYRIVMGDGRLSLAREPDGSIDALIMDAFSSDSVPVHLLTREAVRLYMRKLAPGGLIAVHISNRYLHLSPVLHDVAAEEGLSCRLFEDTVTDEESRRGYTDSEWVVLARSEGDLGALGQRKHWRAPKPERFGYAWTDDFSNVLSVFTPWQDFLDRLHPATPPRASADPQSAAPRE